MNDREYAAYRAGKHDAALVYQDFITDLLHRRLGLSVNQYASRKYQLRVGESRSGIEIKYDEKLSTTDNLWIECKEKAQPRSGDYVPSGIYRSDNAWLYVIGNYDIVFVFDKHILRLLAEVGQVELRENNTQTSVGFLLPRRPAAALAAQVIQPRTPASTVTVVGPPDPPAVATPTPQPFRLEAPKLDPKTLAMLREIHDAIWGPPRPRATEGER